MNRAKLIQGVELMLEAIKDHEPPDDRLYTATELKRLFGVNRNRVTQLKKEGRIPTFENGKKFKYADVLRALQDQPVRVPRTKYLQVFK